MTATSIAPLSLSSTGHLAMPRDLPDGFIFRQLFEHESSTYTYLVADAETKEALLIDPVLETVDRDLQLVHELGLTLLYGVNTHCHADHITGTGQIKRKQPTVRSVIAKAAGAKADIYLEPGDTVRVGRFALKARATPGHTDGCMSFYLPEAHMVFTGDALLIRGCGRTDFQAGSSERLFESVTTQLFTLPPNTMVYPAHDYKGHSSSTIAEEKALNPRLGGDATSASFVTLMKNLNLPYPKKIDASLPANMVCGIQDD